MIVSAAKATEAAGVLGVELQSLTTDAINKAFRNKAKDCHPDHHGNEKLQTWSRVSWAKDCLCYWLQQHPNQTVEEAEPQGSGSCRACKGTGRVPIVKRGYGKPLTMMCIICKGLGTVIPDEDDHD